MIAFNTELQHDVCELRASPGLKRLFDSVRAIN